ncbi:hypothetical protein [Nocardia gamkensis]|uniref:Chromosome segregation ATPase n=1 Tax=Nocardia gamkensis TaxID=352869 RepID=A0A7X6R7C0_9NOCA|nr:hypothetical protein [Nocardia gamkensis]NKY31433.1 hypothetical protein [Nocardia gamkensis]NQE72612.1 DNA helicase [Nocardia gamkensis]
MYELNRVRLYNIGPEKARYDDVTLDLSDGGPPIPIDSLIPTAGQLFRRPSLATLLVLENGGGKSVFIRMLLSTVLPERQSRKGRDALRAYVVSASAPSHVVLEWVEVRTGHTVLTGQALAPGEGPPQRLFYSLSPNDVTSLATLPFAQNGRRLTMTAFHDALTRLNTADKSLALETEKKQGDWERHLRRLGLEPDLFAVQQAMNVDEGDAAEAFKTTSGRQFVEWLLSKAMDAENYTEIGASYTAYAKNIGRREQMLLERDFTRATAAAAHSLATKRMEQITAAAAADTATTTLAQLAAAVRETVARSEQTLHADRAEVESLNTTAGQRDLERTHAELIGKEVRRRTLELCHAQAEADAETISEQLDRHRDELAGWTLVPKVLKAAAEHTKYQIASKMLDEAEAAAGPARRLRDHAGARFASALVHAERQYQLDARTRDEQEQKAEAEAERADEQAREDDKQAITLTTRADTLNQAVTAVASRVAHARETGLIERDETVGDAEQRASAAAILARTQAERQTGLHKQLDAETRRLGETARQLIEPEIITRQAAVTAEQAVADLDTAARALTGEALLRELAELDDDEAIPGGDATLWLEANVTTLRTRAVSAHGSAESRLSALTDADRTDHRLLAALTVDDEALLPPREAVEELVADLADHEIAATAGWRALEQLVNPRRHAEIIQSNPALVDGIIVADKATLDRARTHLASSRPLPAAAVLVTTAEVMENASTQHGTGFVVEPTPALHDPVAAAQAREQARARIDERARAIGELTARRATASRLSDRLDTWIRDHPVSTAERLRSAAHAARERATEAESARETADDAYTKAVNNLELLAESVEEAEAAAEAAERIARECTQLANDVQAAELDTVEIASLTEQAGQLSATAEEHRARATRLRKQSREHALSAESLRRDATAATKKLNAVIYGNEPLDPATPHGDLPTLEIEYDAAASAFRAVEVGEDMRRRVEQAQQAAADLDTELLAERDEIRIRAQHLATTPDAGSVESIEATKRRISRTTRTLETDYQTLIQRIGGLAQQKDSASQTNGSPWIELDTEWIPTDPTDGELLTKRAAAKLSDAQARYAAAAESLRLAERTLRQAESSAREMAAVHSTLKSATRKLELPSNSTPFTGTAAQAQQATEDAVQVHSDAAEDLREAERAVDEAVTDFRDAARPARFAVLKAPAYTQLTNIDTASLVERAEYWSGQLASRTASLDTDLEDSERHRALLIEQLAHHVGEALGLLEKAERLSRLPDSAGAWAGRRILRIGFAKPDPQVLAVRIAETLDDKARTHPALPGMDLLLRCVTTAVPRDFKVEILKPDPSARAEYASISEMANVFSGGQELTGAIMLYCTLAALRASTRRGSRGSRQGGMLILDNPIGKASADYLLSLQMTMAAAVGVQLIFTTGSMEDRVLATFPLCIRLRNDADLRTGTRHLHVIDRILGAPVDDEVIGRVSAARLMTKPRLPGAKP